MEKYSKHSRNVTLYNNYKHNVTLQLLTPVQIEQSKSLYNKINVFDDYTDTWNVYHYNKLPINIKDKIKD